MGRCFLKGEIHFPKEKETNLRRRVKQRGGTHLDEMKGLKDKHLNDLLMERNVVFIY